MVKIKTPKGDLILDNDKVLFATLSDGTRVRLPIKVDSREYASVRIGGKEFYLHRLILKAKENQIVDHRNRKHRLDCRRSNLRFANYSQNGYNRGRASHNKSGFKGVYFCRQTKKWRAEIRRDGKVIKLGRHPTKEQAAQVYDDAAIKYHGQYAYLNFPRDHGVIGRGCE